MIESSPCSVLSDDANATFEINYSSIKERLEGETFLTDDLLEEQHADQSLTCCGKTFCSKSNLRRHQREKHDGGKKFSCVCGKDYSQRTYLNVHSQTCEKTLATG